MMVINDVYPPLIQRGNAKSTRNGVFDGKSSNNRELSIAMFDDQRGHWLTVTFPIENCHLECIPCFQRTHILMIR